jgi:cyclic pyranopterin phosphate synthase
MVLKDACGRPLLNLRIAVTRKCNLNCSFCHREGEESHEKNINSEMTVGEIARMAKIAVGLGIRRIKLTGGEPLTRKDIVEIVEELDRIPDLEDLSMTTNGSLLSSLAVKLFKGGLKRVNISLPTLDEDVYHTLTGGSVDHVLLGVKAAVKAGFFPVSSTCSF